MNRAKRTRIKECIIKNLFLLVALASISILALIVLFLFKEGIPIFKEVSIEDFLFGQYWYPTDDPADFGIFPLIIASIVVTLFSSVIAVPLGLLSAIYISEIAGIKAKEILKPTIELLASLPSVVIGFFGMVVIAPLLQDFLDIPTGLNVFNASLMLALMAVPTISSLSEDAIHAVRRELREASLALGATQWETISRVVLPASLSGICTGIILGMSRAIGETMVVLMVAGGAAAVPESIFDACRPMPASIAAEMAEAPFRSEHYYALFATGIVLFLMTFGFNLRHNMQRRVKRKIVQAIAFFIIRFATTLICLALVAMLGFIVVNGFKAINWTFLTQPPLEAMTKGGIYPAIIGTLYLTVGAMMIAFPLGVGSAIYLNEYARKGKLVRAIRLGVNNLAGVPSVVFGLFGLALFVVFFGFGSSILSGSLTLGFLILPVIIGASEEALKAVPQTYREASLALGATKWETIYRVVLPGALPGILTGSILGIGRAAGETAPIMFTAAAFYTAKLPKSIFDEVMALPYHIYVLATAGTHIEETRPLQYGTALVLISLVLGINLVAIILRTRMRRKQTY